MRKTLTTLAAAILALGLLAGCSGGTDSVTVPAPAVPAPVEVAPAEPAEPAPAAPPAVTDMMQLAMIESHRAEFNDGSSDQQIVAEAIAMCSAFETELNAGGSFTSFLINGSTTAADSYRFGFVLGISLMGQCPELVDHPNYSGE